MQDGSDIAGVRRTFHPTGDNPPSTAINQAQPIARSGRAGLLDRLIGPGASGAEKAGTLAFAIAGGAGALAIGYVADVDWKGWQWVLAALIGTDLMGGIWVNATPAARRWYQRPVVGRSGQFRFVAGHVHPFLVAWLFRGGDWGYGLGLYGFTLAAASLVLALPVQLRAAAALTLATIGIAAEAALADPLPALVWFAPAYLLKLLPAHLSPGDRNPSGTFDVDGADTVR